MPARTKPDSPVDRATAELEQQIAQLREQVQQLQQPSAPAQVSPPSVWDKLCGWLQPPSRTPALPPRRDLFDISPNPVKDLEADPISFGGREPDLFTQPRGPEEKQRLAHYLQAGSLGAQKPLRHVQRRNRQQFILWMALGLAAVIVLWIIIP